MQAKADERMAKQKDVLSLPPAGSMSGWCCSSNASTRTASPVRSPGGMTAQQLQADLVATIRAEFEHNLSQQITSPSRPGTKSRAQGRDDPYHQQRLERRQTISSGIQMSSSIFEQVLKLETLPHAEGD